MEDSCPTLCKECIELRKIILNNRKMYKKMIEQLNKTIEHKEEEIEILKTKIKGQMIDFYREEEYQPSTYTIPY